MKTQFKLIYVFLLTLLIATYSCDNDDETMQINLEDLEVTVDENPTPGQVIATVQSNGNSGITYSITSQTPAGALNIDPTTGELTVADETLFDFETNPTITATIFAEGAVNTATVTISVNNVIETNAQEFTTTVDENPTNGDSLGTVQASGDGSLTFSISSQSPAGAIAVDASTGELTVANATLFDFETNPTITANISLDNLGNTQSLTATISINNINELSVFEFDSLINENPTNGDNLGTVGALGDGPLTYNIISQMPAGAMNINASTGQLTVADAALFDYEANSSIYAEIMVDNSGYTQTTTATVYIDNVREVGDLAFGGVIFWVDPTNNNHGLVVGLNNQSMATQWGCASITTGATGTAIGTGETNTATITAAGCSNTGSAIEIVSNLNAYGYNDWFLPSLDEWSKIDANFAIIWPTIQANGGETFYGTNWTSTEVSATNAYIYYLQNGSTNYASFPKSNSSISVRAIRAWTDF